MTVTFIKGSGSQPVIRQGDSATAEAGAHASGSSALTSSLQVARTDAAITSFRSQPSESREKIRDPKEAEKVAKNLAKNIREDGDEGLAAQSGPLSLSALRDVFA
ncbi:MAG: hypothetical protein KDD64_04945 [Bdellovibrionales bacterium]|nr:hypothetical protein [Bdellovibrionales bacterium]